MDEYAEGSIFCSAFGIFSFDDPSFWRIGAGNFASGMVDFCLVDFFFVMTTLLFR